MTDPDAGADESKLQSSPPIDPGRFRQVLGQYPTGVVVIAAAPDEEPPVALTIGSFSSVSLNPPLIAFYPMKTSTSWPKIEKVGKFCVSILGADQESLCRTFASKASNKFENAPWRPAGTGSPIIENAVAWIDCELEAVHDAGDHLLVFGRVKELDLGSDQLPLLFFRGGYGRFTPLSLAAADRSMDRHLRLVDLIRPETEAVAQELDLECLISVRVGAELVVVASAGTNHSSPVPTRVGRRVPWVTPIGAPIAAWLDDHARQLWLKPLEGEPDEVAGWLANLASIRQRGYYVGLGDAAYAAFDAAIAERPVDLQSTQEEIDSAVAALRLRWERFDRFEAGTAYDEIHTISVPVFTADTETILLLSLNGFPEHRLEGEQISTISERLLATAKRATAALGGLWPEDQSANRDMPAR